MAVFEIIEGAPGQGKSLYSASIIDKLFRRNKKYFEKTGNIRRIYTNMKLAPWYEEVLGDYLRYWTDVRDLTKLRDVDVVWDEIATELDAREWENLSGSVKRFLSQYRKRGVDIYANTQDFSMIDVRARLMISGVKTMRKIIGSQDISTTKPPPKFIWGLCLILTVENFREVKGEDKKYELVPDFLFISEDLVRVYDTTQDIPHGEYAPYEHIERKCELHGTEKCSHSRVTHR